MNLDNVIEQPHFNNCPDCGALKIPMITPGGLNLGFSFDCECAYNREMAKIEFNKNKHSDELKQHNDDMKKKRIAKSGLSKHHLDLISMPGFLEGHPLINEARKYYSSFTGHEDKWMFLMAGPGTGKTTMLTWLGLYLIKDKWQRVGYFVMGDLIEEMKARGYDVKTTLDDLLSFDVLILDDFFKGTDCAKPNVQDQFKRIMDSYIRHGKVILIGADISLPTIYNKLTPEYQKQITGRINEQAQGFIIGKNDLINMRDKP